MTLSNSLLLVLYQIRSLSLFFYLIQYLRYLYNFFNLRIASTFYLLYLLILVDIGYRLVYLERGSIIASNNSLEQKILYIFIVGSRFKQYKDLTNPLIQNRLYLLLSSFRNSCIIIIFLLLRKTISLSLNFIYYYLILVRLAIIF